MKIEITDKMLEAGLEPLQDDPERFGPISRFDTHVVEEILSTTLGPSYRETDTGAEIDVQIEVTDEMIQAGVRAFYDTIPHEDPAEQIVTEVFQAMLKASFPVKKETPEGS